MSDYQQLIASKGEREIKEILTEAERLLGEIERLTKGKHPVALCMAIQVAGKIAFNMFYKDWQIAKEIQKGVSDAPKEENLIITEF